MRLSVLLFALALFACTDDSASAEPPSRTDATPTSATDEPTASRPDASAPSAASVDLVTIDMPASVAHADGPSDLTLRAQPTTQSQAVTTMPDGADVRVEECQDLSFDDAWCRLTYETAASNEGWAKRRHLDYLVMQGSIDEQGVRWYGDFLTGIPQGVAIEDFAFTVDQSWDIQADDGYVNVRSGPGSDTDVVGRLENGAVVEVGECSAAQPGQRWCAVSGPAEGFVHQSGFHLSARGF